MVPRAYLRVFEPLDAFPPLEREWWGSYVADGPGITRAEAESSEAEAAVRRLLTGRGSLRSEAALVRRVGRRVHICPLELELRAATALRSFRQQVPRQLVDAFMPDADSGDPLESLGGAGRPPHIREAPWTVPLVWFVLFDPAERHHVDPPEGRGPRLTYLTSLGQASERLERAIDVVEEHLEHGEDVLAELADLVDWSDEFDDKSLLELDYGGLLGLGHGVADDNTCADIWRAIDSLSDGDQMAAAAYYGVARSRWARLRDMRSAN